MIEYVIVTQQDFLLSFLSSFESKRKFCGFVHFIEYLKPNITLQCKRIFK